jgi:hypothetical protein
MFAIKNYDQVPLIKIVLYFIVQASCLLTNIRLWEICM